MLNKLKNMFNFNRLSREDLEELRKRTEHINQQVLIVQLLNGAKNQWLLSKFSKYGLDTQKNYNIDIKTGQIKEAKQADVPKPPTKNETN